MRRWKDGSLSWVQLRYLKESVPIQLAEYAKAKSIIDEPAFSWWAPFVLDQRKRFVSAVQTRYQRKHQKYGVELPKTVAQALAIDKETETEHWRNAIKKEMDAVGIAFEILDEDAAGPVGYQKIACHMIFDIKMDLTRKARLVAGGHMTEPPSSITYASVVSRESVRIAFLVAALNELDILSADVGNAYLNAPCREKVYIHCGPEFGVYQGRKAKIVRALYGLKTSGASWRKHLAETLKVIGFRECLADPDVWFRPATKQGGGEYYEYVLVYTDDILAVSEDPKSILNALDQHYLLKPSSIGPPKTYLGAEIGLHALDDDPTRKRWYMSSDKYIKDAVRNVKAWIKERGGEWKKGKKSVFPTNYRPELDVSPFCNDDDANFYQQSIGVLRWAVELGRIDICCEVSMLAAYCASPRQGHLEVALHVFSYLDCHDRSKLVLDDSLPPNTFTDVEKEDWSDTQYGDAVEEIPPNAPEPRGCYVKMIAFVDADHAGDSITRRSRTGCLIYLQRAPIVWYSKKQSGVETSTFGSEFMAMKVSTELVKGLRYKLRMMGVPIDGYTLVLGDNMSVIKNVSGPTSQLKKKSNSIAYHFVREQVAADIIRVAHESTETNIADMLTKPHSGPVRTKFARMVLF